MEDAFRRACAEGSKQVFLAHMNLVGFHEAGKTSLAKCLMGKDFDKEVKSTEGIALHYITSTFRRKKLAGKHWTETEIKVDDLNKEVILNMKQFVGVPKENYNMPDHIKGTEDRPGFFQRLRRSFLRCCSKNKKVQAIAVAEGLSMSARFMKLALTSFSKPQHTIYFWMLRQQQ